MKEKLAKAIQDAGLVLRVPIAKQRTSEYYTRFITRKQA